MRRTFSRAGYTLIELIVSLLLISVIILGIFSINMVLSNNTQDYGQRYLVRSETQATLNSILNAASLAVGSAANVGTPSEPDLGILNVPTGNSNQTFCIHQGSETGGTWACYEFDLTPTDTAYKQLWFCNTSYNLSDAAGYRGADPTTLTNCAGSGTFVGTAYNVTTTFSTTANGLFSVTIQNCLNDSASGCNSTGTSTLPASNPEVQVSGSVYPSQEGNG